MIIHLVGAQRTNYPWGFENRLIPAIEESGHTLLSTDYRQERSQLQKRLTQKADLILVCKGEGIDPGLLEACPCITVLWYAEQLGAPEKHDETSLARRKELVFNLHAFDYAFSHDPANLLVYKRLGAQRVFPLPCAAVDPGLNRKLDIPKKYDVVFVGSKTPRRQKLLEDLVQKGINVYSPEIWNTEELNRLFNESRIVLNLHLSDLPNTETRVAEVLGAGSFLLSEPLSDSDIVQPGKHFAEFASGDIEELAGKIRYYLVHERQRETIAMNGYGFIHQNHTYAKRIQTILDTVDFSLNRRIWPSYSLGIPLNTRLQPTLRLDRYNALVKESLKTELKLTDEFVYSQQWYDTEYHLERLGLDVRTFDEIRTQYEKNIYRKRLQAILDFAKIDQGPLNWLEVGCHVGMTAYWVACRYPQAHLYMFDFSKTSIHWLQREFPFRERAAIWQTSVEDIRMPDDSLDDRMDVVTCMDVTEHLPDPVYRKMIDELKRVMKPSGLLILLQGTAPNEEHIHILPEERIDADFLAAGFEKIPSMHPTVHLFRKACDESLSGGDRTSHQHSVSASVYLNVRQPENPQSLKTSAQQTHAVQPVSEDNFKTSNYWEKRYQNGGNSGNGSYGLLATFKARCINDFISEKNIKSCVEFGVGDGNNLNFYNIKKYLGLDVSRRAIEICKNRYHSDGSKQFAIIDPLEELCLSEKYDCALSIDVLYHLLEQNVYKTHLRNLFAAAEKYVIIYAWDTDIQENMNLSIHVKPRKFTTYIYENFKEWNLLRKIEQIYADSSSSFYFYEKRSPSPVAFYENTHRTQEKTSDFLGKSNVEAYKNSGWGLSRLAFQQLFDIIKNDKQSAFRIIEFGSGISTEFLVDCALKNPLKKIEILSFDNDPEYMYKPTNNYGFLTLRLRNLLECEEGAYESMFAVKKYSREQMREKTSPLTTRQRNNFYDIQDGDISGYYNLMILDGPNGNGRNFAFLHMLNHLQTGSYVLIDDFTHYDFVERFRSLYTADELFRWNGGILNKWENGGDFIIYRLT